MLLYNFLYLIFTTKRRVRCLASAWSREFINKYDFIIECVYLWKVGKIVVLAKEVDEPRVWLSITI